MTHTVETIEQYDAHVAACPGDCNSCHLKGADSQTWRNTAEMTLAIRNGEPGAKINKQRVESALNHNPGAAACFSEIDLVISEPEPPTPIDGGSSCEYNDLEAA